MVTETLLDVLTIAAMIVVTIGGLLFVLFLLKPIARHAWHEVDSSDVATVHRRAKR